MSVNVDVVRREFETLLARTQAANEQAGRALEEALRLNFADGDGRLPRTLERFLGDRGALRTFVDDLFDEHRRDSAIGRMRELLGGYFDGDASRLAVLLDPTRLNSPLHQFRLEVTEGFGKLNDRLTAIEAAAAARGAERARSTVKGADFEDLLADILGDIARGCGDLLDRTGTEAGATIASKKGDFVLTLDPGLAGGAELRVVIEAKDRIMSGPGDARRAARSPHQPRRRGRPGRLHAGPCPGRHRAVRRARRRRLLRRRSGGAGPRDPRGGGPPGPSPGPRHAARAARRPGRGGHPHAP